ncbi:hypothetical protein B0H13DRAFT_2648542 [Mycena leptocephala]|nr:hypothetical protein B0H13DRAFT_2648542 [Mycena leptocephala]
MAIGERNFKMREERKILLDRIIELESELGIGSATAGNVGASASGAFPRSLLDPRERTRFVRNLRAAAAEEEAEM